VLSVLGKCVCAWEVANDSSEVKNDFNGGNEWESIFLVRSHLMQFLWLENFNVLPKLRYVLKYCDRDNEPAKYSDDFLEDSKPSKVF
jgi:hypothetical protein